MRIKEILKQRGLTAKELAKQIGMTEVGLSIALSDNGNPPLSRLRQIANALGCNMSELFSDEDFFGKGAGSIRCPHCGAPLKLIDATNMADGH